VREFRRVRWAHRVLGIDFSKMSSFKDMREHYELKYGEATWLIKLRVVAFLRQQEDVKLQEVAEHLFQADEYVMCVRGATLHIKLEHPPVILYLLYIPPRLLDDLDRLDRAGDILHVG